MAEGRRPSWRGAGSRAHWLNALAAPLNLALMIGILLVGVVVGAPLALSVALAGVVYAAAAVRTLLEEQGADHRAERSRAGPGDRTRVRAVAIEELAPEIRAQVDEVRRRASRIQRAIEAAGHPYEEARAELDGFVGEAERSARAAQMLQEGLSGAPRAVLKDRLSSAQRDYSKGGSADAVRERLEVAQRIESQLAGYHAEIERLCARLDAVGDDLLSSSAMTVDERRLAVEVRGLREEMSALAAGVESAYQEAPT